MSGPPLLDLLVFRFASLLLEPAWNRNYVASVKLVYDYDRPGGAAYVPRPALRRHPSVYSCLHAIDWTVLRIRFRFLGMVEIPKGI